MSAKDVTDVDIAIGVRIRERRQALRMSQSKLAEASGITFQQVQKYEKGVNRISAGRLLLLAKALDMPAATLLEEPDEALPTNLSAEALRGAAIIDGLRDRHRRGRFVDAMALLAPARTEKAA